MNCITTRDFVNMICRADGKTNGAPGDILNTAYSEGWLEAQDISGADNFIIRSDAARILHMFMLKIKDIKDLPDISGAEILKDLYDCRICVNHIAQVYLRGLIPAVCVNTSDTDSFYIFDSKSFLSEEESVSVIENLLNIKK
jgi:hypothetical protein